MTATVHIARPAGDADYDVEIVRRDPSGAFEVIEPLKRGETRVMHVWQGCEILIREKHGVLQGEGFVTWGSTSPELGEVVH